MKDSILFVVIYQTITYFNLPFNIKNWYNYVSNKKSKF